MRSRAAAALVAAADVQLTVEWQMAYVLLWVAKFIFADGLRSRIMADFILKTESDRSRLMGHIAGLSLEKPKKVTIKDVKSNRSVAQNRLLWMWNGLIQTHLRESFGQIASSEQWHEILVSRLWPSEIHLVRLPDGQAFRVGRAKTSQFNSKQMTDYLELLDAYCAENLGLILPRPSDLMDQIYGHRR